ncbi:MAG: tetratricopeptide repeat protein [Steroidobacter sp.]
MKNKLRIAALAIAVLLASWLVVRGCTPEPEPVKPPPASPREAFHAGRPLRLVLIATPDKKGERAQLAWLEHELHHLLTRGKMHIAPVGLHASRAALSKDATGAHVGDKYVLRVALAADAMQGSIALIAPDQVLEREHTFEIAKGTRLAVAHAFGRELPAFLSAPDAASDWSAFLGTSDAKAYETFTRALSDILGPDGRGFTRPPTSPARVRSIERLESLTKSDRRFARARALLAIGYLSLGGEDEASLTQLAESSAERAVALDTNLAEAHAALGLVALRRNEWIAARDQFDAALTLNQNSVAALEGLACLLADAGLYNAAKPIARRAVALQPRNVGANECLAYVVSESAETTPAENGGQGAADGQVLALKAILAGDLPLAERVLRDALHPRQFALWAQPVLRAAGGRRYIPDALRAVTRSANDERIGASTEVLCGAALRQSEFVFNRMTRLQRQRVHAPLRILWLPETGFLRQHARFEDIISTAGLPAFWQEHGAPDICAREPATYGCKAGREANREEPRKTAQRNE